MKLPRLALGTYLALTLVPIYSLVGMSLKTNEEILGRFTLFPAHPTLQNFATILTDPDWSDGYVNSMTYVAINTVFSPS
jgi:glycerol transport system permease protein